MSETAMAEYLASLLDAPVFIDERKIEHLYDNTVRLMSNDSSIGEFVANNKVTEEQKNVEEITDINNIIDEKNEYTQQKLFQILQLYDENFSQNITTFTNTSGEELSNNGSKKVPPRQLVYLDLPGKDDEGEARDTKFIPTAAEFQSDHVEILAEHFRLKNLGSWEEVANKTSANLMIAVLEEQVQKEGPIKWIDFRLPITDSSETIHLHCSPQTEYDVSAFAYNFVKQGFKHGIKVIGTLNRGPDIDVLAIYRK